MKADLLLILRPWQCKQISARSAAIPAEDPAAFRQFASEMRDCPRPIMGQRHFCKQKWTQLALIFVEFLVDQTGEPAVGPNLGLILCTRDRSVRHRRNCEDDVVTLNMRHNV